MTVVALCFTFVVALAMFLARTLAGSRGVATKQPPTALENTPNNDSTKKEVSSPQVVNSSPAPSKASGNNGDVSTEPRKKPPQVPQLTIKTTAERSESTFEPAVASSPQQTVPCAAALVLEERSAEAEEPKPKKTRRVVKPRTAKPTAAHTESDDGRRVAKEPSPSAPEPATRPALPPRVPVTPPPGVARPVTPQVNGARTASPVAPATRSSPGRRLPSPFSGNRAVAERSSSGNRPTTRPTNSPFRRVVDDPSFVSPAPYTPPAVRNYHSDATLPTFHRSPQHGGGTTPAAAVDSDYLSAPVPSSRPRVKKATTLKSAAAAAVHKKQIAEIVDVAEDYLRQIDAQRREMQREREETARQAADLEADRKMMSSAPRATSSNLLPPPPPPRRQPPPNHVVVPQLDVAQVVSVSPMTNGGLESRRTLAGEEYSDLSSRGGPPFSSREDIQSEPRGAPPQSEDIHIGLLTPSVRKPRERLNSTYGVNAEIHEPENLSTKKENNAFKGNSEHNHNGSAIVPIPATLVEEELTNKTEESASDGDAVPLEALVSTKRERHDSRQAQAPSSTATNANLGVLPVAEDHSRSPQRTQRDGAVEDNGQSPADGTSPRPRVRKTKRPNSGRRAPSNEAPPIAPTIATKKERIDSNADKKQKDTATEADLPTPLRDPSPPAVETTPPPRPTLRDRSNANNSEEEFTILVDANTLPSPRIIANGATAPPPSMTRRPASHPEPFSTFSSTIVVLGGPAKFYDMVREVAVLEHQQQKEEIKGGLHEAMLLDCSLCLSIPRSQLTLTPPIVITAPHAAATSPTPSVTERVLNEVLGNSPRQKPQQQESDEPRLVTAVLHVQYDESFITSLELEQRLREGGLLFQPSDAVPDPLALLQQQPSGCDTGSDVESAYEGPAAGRISATRQYMESLVATSVARPAVAPASPNRQQQENNTGDTAWSPAGAIAPQQQQQPIATASAPAATSSSSSSSRSNTPSRDRKEAAPTSTLLLRTQPTELTFQSGQDSSVLLSPPAARTPSSMLTPKSGRGGDSPSSRLVNRRASLRPVNPLTLEFGENGCEKNSETYRKRQVDAVTLHQVMVLTQCEESSERADIEVKQVGEMAQLATDECNARRALCPADTPPSPSKSNSPMSSTTRRKLALVQSMLLQNEDDLRNEIEDLEEDQRQSLLRSEAEQRERYYRRKQEACVRGEKRDREELQRSELRDRTAALELINESLKAQLEKEAEEAAQAEEESLPSTVASESSSSRSASIVVAVEAEETHEAEAEAPQEEPLISAVVEEEEIPPPQQQQPAVPLLDTDLSFIAMAQADDETWDGPSNNSPNSKGKTLAEMPITVSPTSRPTKAFHYATFETSDMEHYPSAVLALRGMLHCYVRRGLDVQNVEVATQSLAVSVRAFHFGKLLDFADERKPNSRYHETKTNKDGDDEPTLFEVVKGAVENVVDGNDQEGAEPPSSRKLPLLNLKKRNSTSSSSSSTSSESSSSSSSQSDKEKEFIETKEGEHDTDEEAASSEPPLSSARFLDTEQSPFQDGDTLLDFDGHALHSHGHLRDLLAKRAISIQEAMLKEIEPDVANWTQAVTHSPALGEMETEETKMANGATQSNEEGELLEFDVEAMLNKCEAEAAASARRRLMLSAKLARLIAQRFSVEVTVIRNHSEILVLTLDS